VKQEPTDESAGNRGRDHDDDQRCTNVSEDVSDGRALSVVDDDGNDNGEKDGADNQPSCLRRASTVPVALVIPLVYRQLILPFPHRISTLHRLPTATPAKRSLA